jgi:hypothetical protein
MDKPSPVCRACGKKDHAFSKCVNVRALHEIILDQDQETRFLMNRVKHLDALQKEQEKMITWLHQFRQTNEIFGRLLPILIDKIEERKYNPDAQTPR